MIKTRDDLKKRYKTGMYPTEEDFANVFDSYFHKLDKIDVFSITGLNEILNQNNTYLLNEVTKLLEGVRSIQYKQQDLDNIVLTAFKQYLSINKIDAGVLLSFQPMAGIVGKITLLIQNISDSDLMVTIPVLAGLVNLETSNEITLSSGSFAQILITGFGNYQTIKYSTKQGSDISIPSMPENKYPDVWRENIIEDVDEDVCRIGEQIFTRRNLQYKGGIADNFIGKVDNERLYNWRMFYSWANIPETTLTGVNDPAITQAVQEYGDFFGRVYFSLVFIGGIIDKFAEVQGSDIYKHQIPHKNDVLQLLAFTLCEVWNGKDEINDELVAKTKGVLGIKGSLGDDPNDNIRFTYPDAWSRDILINGSDKYAIALSGSGVVHRGDASAENITGFMFTAGRYLLRPVSDGAPYNIFAWQYRKSQNVQTVSDMTYGSLIRDENSAAMGATIRTVRYIDLGFEIYTNGTDIIRLFNNVAVPDGYTAIPKGALRGSYFANPDYSLTQLKKIAAYVETITSQWVYSIG